MDALNIAKGPRTRIHRGVIVAFLLSVVGLLAIGQRLSAHPASLQFPKCRKAGNRKENSVAFCSPAKSLTFSGLVENPSISWQEVKVLTSRQNAPRIKDGG